MSVRILVGDALARLRELPGESVHCCVTSPPYFGLRDYGVEGQIGLEATPAAYVERLVEVFREVRRVLRRDGTCWVNLGDSYSSRSGGRSPGRGSRIERLANGRGDEPAVLRRKTRDVTARLVPNVNARSIPRAAAAGAKPKDLLGLPWIVALALRDDGWYLRGDIIWAKPGPTPESVRDRPTKAHEYVFLLSRRARYWYDAKAISEPLLHPADSTSADASRAFNRRRSTRPANRQPRVALAGDVPQSRNARSVWTIASQPFPEAHFATFPPELPERCIRAGCPGGGVVLDPFGGAGTTGLVADRLQRDAVLIELNPACAGMAERRIRDAAPMWAAVEVATEPDHAA